MENVASSSKTEGGLAMSADNFKEKDYYKDKIIEMVGEIDNPWILKQILRTIISITKED